MAAQFAGNLKEGLRVRLLNTMSNARMHDARLLTTTAVTGQVRPNRLDDTLVEFPGQFEFERRKPVAWAEHVSCDVGLHETNSAGYLSSTKRRNL